MSDASAAALVEDLFRRESGHLVAALARLLGPSNLALAEDVVHDALVTAMHAWRFGAPENPKAWILQVARNRAIDILRRERRRERLMLEAECEGALAGAVDLALSPEADAENQLAMMFAICDDALSSETHVTLILRLLCGLSSTEIARAFLVDVQTIDRRLHRGRARLQELGHLQDPRAVDDVRARQPSVEQALYLLFNEGYHGSDADNPLHPAMCADALRLSELLLGASAVEPSTVHALAALFCFNAARLTARLCEDAVIVPLAEQDRSLWDASLFGRGLQHLAASATGDRLTRWHLEAGIAFEHTSAPSVAETNWARIVEYYDALAALSPGPIVALNRGLALAELHGLDVGREALAALAGEPKLAEYSFFWAARADVERRAGRTVEAHELYRRAIALAKSRAERLSYEKRLR
ncbi:RNA polymerase sigma-70 factor, ECF subfamily [Labilithrix luteola]|uniref:RNA polymerase sigma-70 factor, ECF subfamily n=1 Tax=Labilithrix luteola TaxID=1391654 RepID=A0A0K1QE15_9BACT|nr:sigma-70 family RNA polymerase sigma factor [Labilithrix luteola]AKV03963.1 RNA polymerase sigma-70 factor, ECF subfamily [Labilithrix luteola]